MATGHPAIPPSSGARVSAAANLIEQSARVNAIIVWETDDLAVGNSVCLIARTRKPEGGAKANHVELRIE